MACRTTGTQCSGGPAENLVASGHRTTTNFEPCLDVERVHLSFCKRVLHVKRSTANYFIYGELGHFPLQITGKVRILKYWIKIITGMSNPLVKGAHDIEYEMCEKSPSFSSWTMSLKSLLYNMSLNFAWDNQNIVNHNAFLPLCKQRLQDLYLTMLLYLSVQRVWYI